MICMLVLYAMLDMRGIVGEKIKNKEEDVRESLVVNKVVLITLHI
jgi:hypothetical protein